MYSVTGQSVYEANVFEHIMCPLSLSLGVDSGPFQ